jgi:hypothetical protein
VENDGHQIEEEHCFSSTDRWTDRGGKQNNGTFSSRLLHKHPKLWDEQIPYVQHAYNRALHSSTQSSPFETCFGYLPKVPLDLMYGRDVDVNEERTEDRARKFIQRIQQIHQAVREQLEKSQAQYKARHDKHRVDHQFQVGDRVWLHISKE